MLCIPQNIKVKYNLEIYEEINYCIICGVCQSQIYYGPKID